MNLLRSIALLCATLLAASCATGSDEPKQDLRALASDVAASQSPTTNGSTRSQKDAASKTDEPGPSADAGHGEAGSAGPTTRAAQSSAPSDHAVDESDPGPSEVPVSAEVTPMCVVPGAEMHLVVTTLPETATLYHAVYAGDESGADPPAGEGHGGNDAGFSDSEGRYESSWTVSVDAPSGPARVDVMVTTSNGDGETTVVFEVADPVTRRCG